jgi:enoyl-CoA hydratase/carnithine racemase
MSVLLYEERDDVAVLTLDRPQVKNAMNGELMDALASRVAELSQRPDLRAVIVTASGGESFCAGGDLKWLQRYETGEEGAAMGRHMQETLTALSYLPMPVIAVVNGYALGGGAEIALACDMRIMEAHTYLCFKQVRVGLITGWSGGGRLVQTVGYARAMELTTLCPRVDADRAVSIGLANTVVETGEGLSTALAWIDKIKKGAPRATRAMKTLLRSVSAVDIEAAAHLENQLFETVWSAPEHSEALTAFFEGRAPTFPAK